MFFGGNQILKRREFMQRGETTIGEIYGYQKYMNDQWSYIYIFILPTGQKFMGTDQVYHHDKQRKRKKIGEKVQLIYDRENPRKFKCKSDYDIVIGFYLMLIMGIIYLMLGLFLIN